MPKESIRPASAEHYKKRLATKVGALAGTLVLAATLAPLRPERALGDSRPTHPLEYVGVTSNQILVPNLDQARQAAAAIAATNANTVRIIVPYSPGQDEIKNDKLRLCNAAEAAQENNLTLEIGFVGSKINYVPDSAGSVTRYLKTANTILWNLAGPNANKPGADSSPACVEQPLNKLIIEVFNEVNSHTFNANSDPAKKYAYLMSRAGPALANDAANINQALSAETPLAQNTSSRKFTLVRAAGGLAAGSHDPVGFVRRFDQDLKTLGVTIAPYDDLTAHLYPTDPTANPDSVEASIYQPLASELQSSWGKVIPIFYDEVGVKAISAAKRFMYGPKSIKASAVSEAVQGQYYRDTITEAAMEDDVVGVLTFQGQDVRNDGWPSGINTPNGGRKSSWNTVAKTFHDAIAGDLGN